MSDSKRVARDNKHAETAMTTAVVEAKSWLEALTESEHRGRHDTWTAARDRAAAKAGVEPTYAARIWNRWQSMKDVSGSAYRALKLAYDEQCERNIMVAAHYDAMTEALRNGGQTDPDGMAAASRLVAIPPPAPSQARPAR